MLLSVFRINALIEFYTAPFSIYHSIEYDLSVQDIELTSSELNLKEPIIKICSGKEWYRFPSHYFLMDGGVNYQDNPRQLEFGFIPSAFNGQLPQLFSSAKNATALIPPYFNGDNVLDPSAYTDLNDCHYIVDLDLGPDQYEQRYNQYMSENEEFIWLTVLEMPFLDASETQSLFRAFRIPYLFDDKLVFKPYQLLKRHILHPDNDKNAIKINGNEVHDHEEVEIKSHNRFMPHIHEEL